MTREELIAELEELGPELLDDGYTQSPAAMKEAATMLREDATRLSAAERERDEAILYAGNLKRYLTTAYEIASTHDDSLPFDWAVYCEMLWQAIHKPEPAALSHLRQEIIERCAEVADDFMNGATMSKYVTRKECIAARSVAVQISEAIRRLAEEQEGKNEG